jgi:hypothetical protein
MEPHGCAPGARGALFVFAFTGFGVPAARRAKRCVDFPRAASVASGRRAAV